MAKANKPRETTPVAEANKAPAMLGSDTCDVDKKVIFIQYDIPPLKSGEYTIELEQAVNLNTGAPYRTSRKFAVTGQRFTLNPNDINSVFPPNLANGEFSGVFPLMIFNRRTLPWERTSLMAEQSAPWLALLLFNRDQVPEIKKGTAKDLVPLGTTITVEGSPGITGTGAMPAGILSYPGMSTLDYGETPEDQINYIDIPAETFNTVAPSAADLPYLAHIRDTETIDKTDNKLLDEALYAIVVGNRIPVDGLTSYVFLVSLENMGSFLPDENGNGHIPAGNKFIRLLTYSSWHFTANNSDENFEQLLENLNKNPAGEIGLTTLQYPFDGPVPSDTEVQSALNHQANGNMTTNDAQILVHNAFNMGYTAMTQVLRHPGNTVSWYRCPLVPYYIPETVQLPYTTSDAINRYNPETGMFDVSYGGAWQIGQLMALQNKAFSTSLYNWKKSETAQQSIIEEQRIIQEKYHTITAFDGLMAARNTSLLKANAAPLPENVVIWLSQLALLKGVPFNYLVPDERMLPPESMRFFYMDNNWIECLLDGAFSIGRSSTADHKNDLARLKKLMGPVKHRATMARPRKQKLLSYRNASGVITGFLLRSAVVGGWPGLEINGYSDKEGTSEVQKLRMEALSSDTLICIFDGVVQMVAIHEPPEALHEGLVRHDGTWATTLRTVNGTDPGSQIPGAYCPVTLRSDNQTLQVKKAADAIQQMLNSPPYSQNIKNFTSAEYALELIKGVVKVEFLKK
ncbi:hypothetical protein [Emticicia sp. TH156]|uniref:hypothetical protein n=1 Tax=Emticicia sp. TH156 TaxID=2067454 RepID=UPI000C7683D8|nr:hypothetical protein [Emticicia sp. TH156]PLK44534.1 hypothetical protein C0V77_08655 [Emticicia sp. TH156]